VNPLLSVVIPAFNVEGFVGEAIRSILAQTLSDLEVIVVDDGSVDGTAHAAACVADPRVRIIQQAHSGLSAARNAGILAAQGRYVGFLDGDDTWFPTKAFEHVQVMAADMAGGLTYSHSAYLDESGEATGQLLVSTIHRPDVRDMIVRNLVGNGSTPIARHEALIQAGLFDESLNALEDWEMWVRVLGKTRFKALLIPRVLTGYRVRGASMTMNIEKWTHDCEQAVEKFSIYLPERWPRVRRTILAEMYRLTARKALSRCRVDLAQPLLTKALRQNCFLFFRDPRAIGTLLLFALQRILPSHYRRLPYDLALSCLKIGYRAIYAKN